jgi:hypothetical protein
VTHTHTSLGYDLVKTWSVRHHDILGLNPRGFVPNHIMLVGCGSLWYVIFPYQKGLYVD